MSGKLGIGSYFQSRRPGLNGPNEPITPRNAIMVNNGTTLVPDGKFNKKAALLTTNTMPQTCYYASSAITSYANREFRVTKDYIFCLGGIQTATEKIVVFSKSTGQIVFVKDVRAHISYAPGTSTASNYAPIQYVFDAYDRYVAVLKVGVLGSSSGSVLVTDILSGDEWTITIPNPYNGDCQAIAIHGANLAILCPQHPSYSNKMMVEMVNLFTGDSLGALEMSATTAHYAGNLVMSSQYVVASRVSDTIAAVNIAHYDYVMTASTGKTKKRVRQLNATIASYTDQAIAGVTPTTHFGSCMDICNEKLIVGYFQADKAVFIDLSNGTSTTYANPNVDGSNTVDAFGGSVATNGKDVWIGAPAADYVTSKATRIPGAIYGFNWNSNTYQDYRRLTTGTAYGYNKLDSYGSDLFWSAANFYSINRFMNDDAYSIFMERLEEV